MRNKEFILNEKRDFGNIISDGFTFVKRTFKLQAELFLTFVMPILLLAMYALYFVFADMSADILIQEGGFDAMQTGKFILSYGGLVIVFLLFYYIIYSVAIQYEANGSQVPEKMDVLTFMKENLGRYLSYFVVIMLFFVAIGGLVGMFFFASPVLGGLLAFALVIGMVYIVPYFSILPFLYLKEQKGIIEALKDTFKLVKGNWLPTFGVVFITNIIGSFASYILIIPIYVLMILSMFGTGTDSSGTGDDFGFYMSLMMIVSLLSSVIILTYTTSAVILKYYDLKERTGNVSIIDKIDQIGHSETSIFENEGDF